MTLATVLRNRHIGCAALPTDWKNDFHAQWIDMSKPDKLCNIEKQLMVLKSGKKSKCRAEKLTELGVDTE